MSLSFKKTGKKIILEAEFKTPGRTAIFDIMSDRNRAISRISDISAFNPNQRPENMAADEWFPIVDIHVTPQIYGKVKISSGYNDVLYFNGFMNKEPVILKDNLAVLEGRHLLDWENGLFLLSKDAKVERFSLIKEVPMLPTISRRIRTEIETLSDEWGGTIQAYYIDNDGVSHYDSEIVIERGKLDAKADIFQPYGVSSLDDALNMCIGYILRSQNKCENSNFQNGLYLFYDMAAGTYRNGHWPWSWGTAIKLLLEAAKARPNRLSFSPEELISAAYEIGDTSLKLQIFNDNHTAHLFGTTRYTSRTYEPNGYQELVNTGADTGFLAGWGWCSLYEATGEKRFLHAVENYLKALEPILDKVNLPPQEWLPRQDDWSDFTIDESGFGTEGIEGAHLLTGRSEYIDLCRRYMKPHLEIFEREDGLWERRYNSSTKTIDETVFMTRGIGWAMEGLLAAHRCTGDAEYLDKAVKMASVLIEHQLADGSWTYRFTESVEESGTAEKGTALWCLLLYMLYSQTHEEAHLSAARKALKWCMKNIYTGDDPHAYGGIVSISGESGITYRNWFPLCCQYASAFVGLAILEEMKLK